MKTLVYSKGAGGPLILWGTDLSRENEIEDLVKQMEPLIPDQSYTLAAFGAENWNADFSPWEAETAGQKFSGKGPDTLAWLKEDLLPTLKQEYPETTSTFLVGYSLAGLFALWAHYATDLFSGIACCSGSLWFPDWITYAQTHHIPSGSSVYLSLGGKEKCSKDPVLSTIEDNTRTTLELLKKDTAQIKLEMNPGGHFSDPIGRLAKGISWLLN